ncbi:hypothetical protein HMPREF3213_02435 [Heyndrickxia coagulans]|uniref:Uncharacterized protein n=1 Tax=Heyndrickxia coagulans TaxID=1398 RepID=A0A133KK29_HEYCO|nr:hypothetical protein HMPREF3213_02435 [Heyndrickxia coagulans]
MEAFYSRQQSRDILFILYSLYLLNYNKVKLLFKDNKRYKKFPISITVVVRMTLSRNGAGSFLKDYPFKCEKA